MNASIGTARKGAAAGVGTTIGRASGTVTFSGSPSAAQGITVGGRGYGFIASGPASTDQIVIAIPGGEGDTEALANAREFTTTINGGFPTSTANADVYAINEGDGVVRLYARATGPGGNAITLAETADNVAISGATLTGGA